MGKDSIPFTAEMSDESNLKFKNTYVKLNERYTVMGKVKYEFDYANLDIWDDKICGSLKLYSLTQKEPERPMYIEVHRIGSERKIFNKEKSDSCISIMSNPFDRQFDAIIKLTERCTVKVSIFDNFGRLVWLQDYGMFEPGKNRIYIYPNIKQGHYVLNISAGKQNIRTIIVKKGGAK